MKYTVMVKANAREEKVEPVDARTFRVSVKEPPIDGRANAAVEKALAEYLGVAPSRARVVSGHTGKRKIIEVA